MYRFAEHMQITINQWAQLVERHRFKSTFPVDTMLPCVNLSLHVNVYTPLALRTAKTLREAILYMYYA